MSCCGPDDALATAARRVEQALEGEAGVLGGWVDVETLPPMRAGQRAVRLVYAFPSRRLATLRHWRDELELVEGDLHVVGMEASKWARLVLKHHEPTLAAITATPAFGSAPEVAELRRLGIDVSRSDVGPAERFDRVERWLVEVRRALDSP